MNVSWNFKNLTLHENLSAKRRSPSLCVLPLFLRLMAACKHELALAIGCPIEVIRTMGKIHKLGGPRTPAGEDQLALDLAAAHRHEMAYVADLKRWFVYDGEDWVPDYTRHVYAWAREICRHAGARALEQNEQRLARSLASARTCAAIVSLASDDQSVVRLRRDFEHDSLRLMG